LSYYKEAILFYVSRETQTYFLLLYVSRETQSYLFIITCFTWNTARNSSHENIFL